MRGLVGCSIVGLVAFLIAGCGGPRLSPLDESSVVVAFGDSLTSGVGAMGLAGYPPVLGEILACEVVNAGVPGEVTAEGHDARQLRGAASRRDLAARCERAAGGQVCQVRRLSLDRVQALGRVADAALEAIPGAADVLVVVRDNGDKWTVRAQAHRGAGLSPRPNDKICARVLERGEGLLFGEQGGAVPATLAASGVGSGIACPIFRAAEVVGALQINCRPGHPASRGRSGPGDGLGEAQLDLAIVLAHHAGTALERADRW